MRKFLLLFTLLIIGCDDRKREEATELPGKEISIDTQSVKTEDRNFKGSKFLKLHVFIPKGIEEQFVPAAPVIKDLATEWTAISKVEGKEVRLIPCKQQNPNQFSISNLDTKYPELHMDIDNEHFAYFIVNVKQYQRLYFFKLIRFYDEEGGMSSNFEYVNLELRTPKTKLIQTERIEIEHEGKKMSFTSKSTQNKYELVKQNPADCQ